MVPRLRFIDAPPSGPQETFSHRVREGLSRHPPSLPCRFFYDDAGSALFERICALPEYYPTRTERAILAAHAPKMLQAVGAEDLALIELGSGSSVKTRLLIEAVLSRQRRLHYTPVDISRDFLRSSARRLLDEYPGLSVTAVAGEYGDALRVLPAHPDSRLLLFLGSNVGNFEPDEATAFLCGMRRRMQPRDRLLIGVDLVKERAVLEAAYNDAAGVTAAFNKNLLRRVNRELGGDFDLDRWEHRAPWVPEAARIEMWLVSRCDQTVTLAGVERSFRFRQGEGIHTEYSHKYTPEGFAALCGRAGLAVEERWTDEREWFAVFLLKGAA